MNYWLMKSEPDTFSIEDLIQCPNQTEPWDGIRNYQARNMMRDQMKIGDLAFFYHSSCKVPAIVGVIEICSEPYDDPTQFDPESKYYDPKSRPDNPRWQLVDVKFISKTNTIALSSLKKYPELKQMRLLQKGNRLSILPISAEEWTFINNLG
ncbi:MAG: EVE domain-containing protein [Shewanellaceae bacterium]|nr:EVE domain-containing protein [Shewanellaceae bacterium]